MKPSIVFFGSGPVAAKSLALLTGDFHIEAIITKPSTLKDMAAIVPDAPTYCVSNKQELNDLITMERLISPVAVLIDFGIIVSQEVIDHFPKGIVNSHFSLLPEWRGADPITFSILSGQKQTGVSLMLLVEKMDEGPLLSQAPYDIPEGTTTPQLTDALVELSAESLKHILPLYLNGTTFPAPQEKVSNTAVSYSRKLTKDDGLIDWSKPAEQIEREVRAYIEWPKSRTSLAGKEIVVTKSHVVDENNPPGDIKINHKQIIIGCGSKSLSLDELKPAGKNKMSAEAFLAGYGKQLH